MPIYEYLCEHCGTFEQTQRITEPALGKCPKCRRKVKRLISNTSFQLKGSGWYVTDYARGGTDGKDGKKDAPGDSTAKADAKTEGTPPAKSDTKSKAEKAGSTPPAGGEKASA